MMSCDLFFELYGQESSVAACSMHSSDIHPTLELGRGVSKSAESQLDIGRRTT